MKLSELQNYKVVSYQGPKTNPQSLDTREIMGFGEKIAQGASNIISSIEQPFVSLAAKPVQLLAKGLGQPDPFAEGVPTGLPGTGVKAPVSPATASGFAGDVLKAGATTAAVATGPAGILRATATGAGIGAATMGGEALQQGQDAGEVVKKAGQGAFIGGATGGLFSLVGKSIGAIGNKIQRSVIKPSKADIEDGFTMETIKKYDLGGSLNKVLSKTQTKLTELSDQLNTKLASSPERLNLDDIFKETAKELTDSSKLKGFGANTKIMNGLNQLKEEIGIVNQAGGVSIPEAQIIKQASGSFGAWQFGKPDPDSKATEIIYNTFYNKLKTAIEKASPDGVKEINKQLAELIPVSNAVIRRLPVAERSNIISLNEMIGLVGSSVNPVALGPTLLALISRSGTAGNILSKTGGAVGKTAVPASFVTSKLGEQVSDKALSAQSQSIPTYPTSNTGSKKPQQSFWDRLIKPEYTPEQKAAVKDAFERVKEIDPSGVGGLIKGVAPKVLSKVHPEDVTILKRFIDGVRLNKETPMSVERGAQALAEYWGLNVQKSAKYLADEFEKILSGTRDIKGTLQQARDEVGRFTK